MKFLLIEDEHEFIQEIKQSSDANNTVFSPEDVGLRQENGLDLTPGVPAEDQLAALLARIIHDNAIDLVILDTDLSRARHELEAQSGYRLALQQLGMPLCRYQKGGSPNRYSWWKDLQRVMREGSDGIWIPREKVSGDDVDKLVPWLADIATGFSTIAKRLQEKPQLLEDKNEFGPADVLAIVLDKPEAKGELLGYTSPSLFFFATAELADPSALRTEAERFATRLGYWLFNYVLTFPGPILPAGAAAAFLNLTPRVFEHERVQALVNGCRYAGPFSNTQAYYWRSELAKLLDDVGGDIAKAPMLEGLNPERLDAGDPFAEGYWCVLSQQPVLAADAAATPEWIPSGASQSRITQSKLDEIGPLLSI